MPNHKTERNFQTCRCSYFFSRCKQAYKKSKLSVYKNRLSLFADKLSLLAGELRLFADEFSLFADELRLCLAASLLFQLVLILLSVASIRACKSQFVLLERMFFNAVIT